MRIATFNANNLFSRWSFEAELPRTATVAPTAEVTGPAAGTLGSGAATEAEPVPQPKVVGVTLPDGTALTGILRTFMGDLVRGKDPKARAWIAKRIKELDADVLCLQEVEDQGALDAFNRDDLTPLGADYPYRVVVEGNDPRRIDVALCSRLPIVRVSSWRFWPDNAGKPVFGRDMLQAEVQATDGRSLHVFVNHLKSNYISDEFRLSEQEKQLARDATNIRRTAQAQAIRTILRRLRLSKRVIVCGDFNDDPGAETLVALADHGLAEQIQDATTVAGPDKTGTLVPDKFADLSPTMWTHRHRATGQTTFACYDQIWTSPDLDVTTAQVMRRTQVTGDGSDHDPATINLDL